jgi:hypothetical protein
MKKNELLFNGSKKIISEKMLKENEDLQQTIEYSIMVSDLIANEARAGIRHNVGKYMKIFSFLAIFTGLLIVMNSCMGGYMATEPTYTEYARPPRPSQTHIWIDGNWGWNSHSHVYVQRAGYWEKPRVGHTYISGRWESSQKGKSWSKGYWQKDNQQRNSRRNNNGYQKHQNIRVQ